MVFWIVKSVVMSQDTKILEDLATFSCIPCNGSEKSIILPSFLLACMVLKSPHVFPILYLCLLPSPTHFTLKMEAALSSKCWYPTAQCHNPEIH